jgi:hypothetical protein
MGSDGGSIMYAIEYMDAGLVVAKVHWSGTFEAAQAEAISGLRKYPTADFVRLIEVGGSGAEVWSERNETKRNDARRP